MMDIHETYDDNHFMVNVNQIITLCPLNLHRAECQLYLNNTGRKKGICKKCKQSIPADSFLFWKISFLLMLRNDSICDYYFKVH